MATKSPQEKHSEYRLNEALASSGDAGFFQASPVVRNVYDEDEALKRITNFYLPANIQASIRSDLNRFGSLVVSPTVLAWNSDAQRNYPYVRTHDTWGRRVDDLITSEGWQRLQALGIQEGIAAIPYENEHGAYSRVHQFLKYVVWSGSSSTVTCPSAMTDGAATLLRTELRRDDLSSTERNVFGTAYRRLVSRDSDTAWTSGQWMTERAGGSDVRNTETMASYIPVSPSFESSNLDAHDLPLGPWSLSGFKWFASAADCHVTVMLAKLPSGSLSAFLAPLRRRPAIEIANASRGIANSAIPTTVPNGLTIQRLKSKLGTNALPSAELVLHDTRAYLLGQPGQGVKTISAILNITRMHNAFGALGGWSRGLLIARAFARVRKVSGILLCDMPAHVRTLAEQHVTYRAMLHLSFFPALLMGRVETSEVDTPGSLNAAGAETKTPVESLFTAETAPLLLRLLTPVSKALTAKAAIAGLAECMEALGGVGYLENSDVLFNIAQLYRDANVLSIWEGTTNIMAADLVRVVKGRAGPQVMQAFDRLVAEFQNAMHNSGKEQKQLVDSILQEWKKVKDDIEGKREDELRHRGRELLQSLGWIICGLLLGMDAMHTGDQMGLEVWKRHCRSEDHARDWQAEAVWDKKIVFGSDSTLSPRANL